jgi:hypothetical protein
MHNRLGHKLKGSIWILLHANQTYSSLSSPIGGLWGGGGGGVNRLESLLMSGKSTSP